MITATPDDENGVKDAGFLIYAGGDPNKKTGTLNWNAYGASTAPAGSVAFVCLLKVMLILQMITFYTEKKTEVFMVEAFTFRLQPFKQENGVLVVHLLRTL